MKSKKSPAAPTLFRVKKSVTDAMMDRVGISAYKANVRAAVFTVDNKRRGFVGTFPKGVPTVNTARVELGDPLAQGYCIPLHYLQPVSAVTLKKLRALSPHSRNVVCVAIRHKLLSPDVPYAKLLKAAKLLGVDVSQL